MSLDPQLNDLMTNQKPEDFVPTQALQVGTPQPIPQHMESHD